MQKTIVFDFDGVIHKYSKGWQDGSIYDEPNRNIKETIDQLRAKNYKVVIVSTRCNTLEGINEINNWLSKYNIVVDDICKEKPPAIVYIDDRAIKYDPISRNLIDQIDNFTTYQKDIQILENLNEEESMNYLQQLINEYNTSFEKFKNLKDTDKIPYIMMLKDFIKIINKYL